MENAGVLKKYRDYCAHHLLDLQTCKREKWPFAVLCKPIAQEYDHCEFEE